MAGSHRLHSYPGLEPLCAAVAAGVVERWVAPRGGRPFGVALSGGRIAPPLFSTMADLAAGRDLRHVHFFWADERCLPPADPETNYAPAREFLFQPLQIAAENIHRIFGEQPPDLAARQAEAEILRRAPLTGDGQPALDLILLGMGEDGHVASLFPNEDVSTREDQRVYRAVFNSPKPPPQRITLGYGAIAAAQQVWVVISGAGKQNALRQALAPGPSVPLGRVLQQRTETEIFVDFAL